MITEVLMRAGSFDIGLELEAPWDLFTTVLGIDEGAGGHVVITPQWLDADVMGDTAMIAAARYAGPVLNKEFRDGVFTISGAGMGWWLGDEDGKGDVHESQISLATATLATSIAAAIPPGGSITAGTIGAGELTYTGEHIYQTPLEVIRTIVAGTMAEYRVNPDGTIDASRNDLLFDMTPNVVVARLISGSDPEYSGVPIATARSTRNSRRYATRAILVKTEIDGSHTLVAGQAAPSAATGKDIHGNAIDRTLIIEGDLGVDVSASGFLQTELRDHTFVEEMELTTGFWELLNGEFNVGDTFWIYDPPALVDTTNEIWFRGDYLFPIELRLVRATWPLVRGMGVWFRDGAAAWTDLTDFVLWDVNDAQSVDTAQSESALRGGRFAGAFGGTTLTVRMFVKGEAGG